MLRKMLVVDDSLLLHKMYDLVLRRYATQGTAIVHAYNGAEALKLLGLHADVDLILLDVNMPTMDGLEFLRLRRPDPVLASIAVIVVSTEGKDHDTQLAMSEGASDYITKPFDPARLHGKIEAILRKGGAERRAHG
jgi:two-component system, chemotaxis family, chemotaxis protein CheY